MANDREQKIRDVYEAMCKARVAEGYSQPTPHGEVHRGMMRNARAAVDLLDPVKRIELSGGFHAEPVDGRGDYRLYKNGGDWGLCGKELVEAWAAAAAAKSETDHARDEVIENLKQRIATLSKIIEAVTPNALNPSAIDTDGTPRT
jgi:hypothetical protein